MERWEKGFPVFMGTYGLTRKLMTRVITNLEAWAEVMELQHRGSTPTRALLWLCAAEGFDGFLKCLGTQTEPRTVDVPWVPIVEEVVVQSVGKEVPTPVGQAAEALQVPIPKSFHPNWNWSIVFEYVG